MIAVSIVSHGHGVMVERLVAQLRDCPEVSQIVLTLNIPEGLAVIADDLVRMVRNVSPRGFGANHNAAFATIERPSFYCVLNPDVELVGNPFPDLLACLARKSVGLAAPLILSPAGEQEDSARYFPTLASLLRKALWGDEGRYVGDRAPSVLFPDWVAGMFMLFRFETYAALGGFDESYFLYYEDVDICKRAKLKGWQVALCPAASAVHDARRASRRSLRHLRWHLSSMVRYLWRNR